MSKIEQQVPAVEQRIRELAAELRTHRQHPCLLFVSRTIQHSDVLAVRAALEEGRGDHLDLIVVSPGGDIEAAYLVARELRRRFTSLAVFVPFQAKSAATLLCLAGDELVLGSLGELGPSTSRATRSRRRMARSAPPGSCRSRHSSSSSMGPRSCMRRSSAGSRGRAACGSSRRAARRQSSPRASTARGFRCSSCIRICRATGGGN